MTEKLRSEMEAAHPGCSHHCPHFQDLISRLEDLEYGFPDGPHSHRESHLAWMAAKKAETEFWKELKLEVAKKSAWGFITIVFGLILLGIMAKLGIAIKS